MDEEHQALVAFFRRLTALFHLYPVLRRSRFLTGEMDPDIDVKDVTWIDANGSEMTPETWDNELRAASACCSTGARRRPASSGAAAT